MHDPDTIEVSDWIVEKQIARIARKTKAEKGEKAWWITIHVDKEAEEGTGQATTTGGTNMAHNDLQVRPMKIGIQSVASPMSQTGPTLIVRQRPILVLVGRPLHHQRLVLKAALGHQYQSGHRDGTQESVQKERQATQRANQASEKWEDSGGSFFGTEATSTRTEVE